MAGKLTLEVVEGPMKGRQFPFDEHDVFLFGRAEDCHACLADDPLVSRHHFILEVNPPDARVRDLGSLNGTYVNGTKHGGREQGETPEEGAKRRHPEVDLKHGDRIEVGDTTLSLHVEAPTFCCECGREVVAQAREPHPSIANTFVCTDCRKKLVVAAASPQALEPVEPVRCQSCGKDATAEAGNRRAGPFVCKACQAKAEGDPLALLRQLLGAQAVRRPAGQPAPGMIAVGREPTPDIVNYKIDKKLGQGGMGVVYLARHKETGQKVALKVMLSKVAVDDRSREAFKREMEVARSLRHPNIVEFIDHGSAGTAFYFVMEFCIGGGVDVLMGRHGGKLPVAVAGPIMVQVLEGMAFAHSRDCIHRDIKPQNILLQEAAGQRVAKVTDFGLAKNFDKAGFSGMTMTGSRAGTPVFMPREQVTNFKYVKPPTDVWSLGASFYNMLTGRFPRDARRGQDPMEIVLHGGIVPIRRRDRSIPGKLADVIDRSLQTAVKDRYQDAGQMLEAMRKAL